MGRVANLNASQPCGNYVAAMRKITLPCTEDVAKVNVLYSCGNCDTHPWLTLLKLHISPKFPQGKKLTDGQKTLISALVVIALSAVVWWLMIEGIIKVFLGNR